MKTIEEVRAEHVRRIQDLEREERRLNDALEYLESPQWDKDMKEALDQYYSENNPKFFAQMAVAIIFTIAFAIGSQL